MPKPESASSDAPGTDPPEGVLKAKYLDYCSARVAEVLLRLSPDEMYLMAQNAAALAGRDDESAPLSYNEMMRLATERISSRVELPSFEEWVQAYRQDPSAIERELIGLWRSELSERNEDPTSG